MQPNLDSYIYHYGVKGMKWGVITKDRKKKGIGKKVSQWKKTDPEQRRLARIEKARSKAEMKTYRTERKTALQEQRNKLREEKKRLETEKNRESQRKKREELKKKYINDPRKVYKNRDLFTVDELNDIAKRIQSENALKKAANDRFAESSKRVETGAKFVNNVLNMATAGGRAYNIAAHLYNAYNAANNTGKKSMYILPEFKWANEDKKKDNKKKEDEDQS